MALTKKQQKIRATGIGASEIPVVAGLSRWGSPAEIWARKLGKDTRDPSLAMELGNLTEDPIARLYARQTGRHLEKVTTLRHPEHEIVVATPDRLVFDRKPAKGFKPSDAARLLQVKHTTWRLRELWGEEGTDQIPEDHLAQVTWEMATAGVPRCDVAVLFDKDEFRIYSVELNADLFRDLLAIGSHFWRTYVVGQVPPPADASERYREALSAMFPEEKTKELRAAPPELEDLALRLRVLEAIEKEANRRGEVIRNEFRRYIGDATGFTCRAGTVTWKKAKDGAKTDWEAVARELADLVGDGGAVNGDPLAEAIARHTKPVQGSRRLLKSWAKTLPPALEEVVQLLPAQEERDLGELYARQKAEKEDAATSAGGGITTT